MPTATSADGTTIAYDRLGDGPAVVLLPGAMCTRGVTAPLAEALSQRCTVLNVDRRGRGGSDDLAPAPPYDTAREVEDVAAVIAAEGGAAAVYGHSSGAALALRVAAADVGVTRLVLHDAPYNLPDVPTTWTGWHDTLLGLLAEGRHGDAVAAFMGMVGVPDPVVDQMRQGPGWPAMEAVAPSLAYDSAAMDDEHGGLLPLDLLPAAGVPTLVMVGGADHPFMLDVAHRLVDQLADARLEHLVDAGHDAGPDVVAPPLLAFLASAGDA